MQECNIDELIQDFENYIPYVKRLVEIHERDDVMQPLVYSVPKRLLSDTKGVYCFEDCSVVPYVRGLCHHYEDAHRRTRDRDKIRAKKEIEENPMCEYRWKDFKNGYKDTIRLEKNKKV